MSDSWKWKFYGTVLGIVFSLYLLVPTLLNFKSIREAAENEGRTPPAYLNFFPSKNINLGLDLRGGMYLEMDVDLEDALRKRVEILIGEVEKSSQEKFSGTTFVSDLVQKSVLVTIDADKKDDFLNFAQDRFGDIWERTAATPKDAGKVTLNLKLSQKYLDYTKQMTSKQAEEAVSNRIDRYGVSEASIQRQGEGRLVIEIPGVKDPQRVVNVIRQTGQLEFRLVDNSQPTETLVSLVKEARQAYKIPEGDSKDIVQKINEALKGKIADTTEVAFQVERDPITQQPIASSPLLIEKKTSVTGEMLRNAQVNIQDNEPFVSLSFNKMGTTNFGDLTKSSVGRRLAILLDGKVMTAPTIQEPILNGEARITLGYGGYDSLMREAEDLALILREGALPATLTIVNKTLIGPSLGKDSIEKGLNSIFISAIVIFIFMGIYYKLGGLLANAALALNLLFIFAFMALFQASLSLPGLAGIVLTLGMAVDANIIIFERMREEARLGKNPRAVVDSGYGNAMSAIIDSNITTLISGIVLYQFGTGPIKGFAATLIIGIFTTMFTAIVVTRLVYDYVVIKRKITRLSI